MPQDLRARRALLSVSRSSSELSASSSGRTSQDPPVCRICWEHNREADKLVAPCQCRGTCRWVHTSCLQQWQQALRAQGSFSKARRCEICKQLYVTNGAAFWRQLAAKAADTAGHWRDLAGSDALNTFVQLWKGAILCGALSHTVRFAATGFELGLALGLASVKQNLSGLLRWAPEALLVSMVVPNLQFPLAIGYSALLAMSAAELAVKVMLGVYIGSFTGFAVGSLRTIQLTLGIWTKLAFCTVSALLHGAHRVGWCGGCLVQGSASLALLLLRGIGSRCLLR